MPIPTPEVTTAEPSAAPPEGGLKDWAPRGRVLDRATGEPVFWTNITYRVRFRVSDENPGSWSERRDPPEEGEESPKDPGAFDLGPMVRQSPMDLHASKEDLSVAEFQVLARSSGYRKGASDWLRLKEFPRDRILVVEMEREVLAQLVARVRTGEGAPFRGRAGLQLFDGQEFQDADPVDANADGVLSFEGLPSGEFRIVVVPAGPKDATVLHLREVSSRKPVALPPGGTAEAEFVLPRSGEIALDVADAAGAALPEWTVRLSYDRGGASAGSIRRVLGCAPGEFELRVWAKGHREWKTTVRVDAGASARVDARLEPEAGGK
jgi:hypothetical protein